MSTKHFSTLQQAEDYLISKGYEKTSYDDLRWRNLESGRSLSIFREGLSGMWFIQTDDFDDEDEVEELNF